MDNLRKVVREQLGAARGSGKTFKDLYDVIFSREGYIAYEILSGSEITRATYGELKLEIERFSAYLGHEYPQKVDEYIGIDLQNSPEFIIAFWAVLKSGNKPYLVNSYYPAPLKHKLLERLEAKLVITRSGEYEGIATVDPTRICPSDKYSTATNLHKSVVGDDAHIVPPQAKRGAGTNGEECNHVVGDDAHIVPHQAKRGTDTNSEECNHCEKISWADEMAISSSLTGLEAKICVFDGSAVIAQICGATSGILRQNNWFMHKYNGNLKVLAVLPFFHIYGLVVSYFWFSFFARTIVFLQDNSPDTIKNAINLHKATHVFAPPILFHKLYKGITNTLSQESEKRKKRFAKAAKLSFALQNVFPAFGVKVSKRLFKEVMNATFGKSVRFMISGGAFIDKEALKLINTIGYPLFNGYGTTETMITSVELKKKIKNRAQGSIGIPFDGIEYTLTDEQTLTISGKTLCKKIISFDSEQNNIDHICTNDIASLYGGKYYIEGRKTDLFIGEDGENISPDIIQNEMKIKNAIDFSVLELDGKLSLVLRYGSMFPEPLIIKEVERIKRDMQDIHFGRAISEIYVTRDRISTANAVNTSRAYLRKLISEEGVRLIRYADMAPSESKYDAFATPAPDDPMILLIKDIFQKALDTNAELDINAHFFYDLGGTSLDYHILFSELSEVFGFRINMEQKNNLYTVLDTYNYLMEIL